MINSHQKGVSLIIVFLTMTVMLTVVLNVGLILFNKVKILSNIGNVISARYASLSGIEKTLYFDRKQFSGQETRGICNMCNTCTNCSQCTTTPLASEGCSDNTCTNCKITYNSIFDQSNFSVSAIVTPNGSNPNLSDTVITAQGVFSNANAINSKTYTNLLNLYLADTYITQEGAHIVGGPGCKTGYTAVSSIADCGGAWCQGNQLLCVKYGNSGNLVRDLYITQEGAHIVGGPGCKTGYTAVSSIVDCGGAWCQGNQLLCLKYGTSGNFIADTYITQEGAHIVGGPGCKTGYTAVSSIVDCGGAWCQGNQLLCSKN